MSAGRVAVSQKFVDFKQMRLQNKTDLACGYLGKTGPLTKSLEPVCVPQILKAFNEESYPLEIILLK